MIGILIKNLKSGFDFFLKSSFFWIGGVGLFSLWILRFFYPIGTEAGEWELYFSFPILTLLLIVVLSKRNSFLILSLRIMLILFFLFVEWELYFDLNIFLLLTLIFPIVYLINRKFKENMKYDSQKERMLPAYVVFVLSFLLSIKLCYWQNFDYYLSNDHPIIVYSIVFILALFSFTYFKFNYPTFLLPFVKLKLIFPVIVFLLFSFKVVNLGWTELHHWGCYIGPAELIKQGGYLLWDVPSQYGFLSVITIALFPMKSCWQSFYILQIIFLFASSFMLFLVLYSSNKNIFNYLFAIAITVVSVFMFPGYLSSLAGVTSFPSVGPYRFLWVQLLMFFLIFQYKKKLFNQRWELIIGTVIWLVSALWSFEVAYYVSIPWFGYLLIKSIQFNEIGKADLRKTMITCFNFFLVPISFFTGSVILIAVFYYIRINNFPDWLSYYEHAISFKNGFESFLINIKGGIGVVLLIIFFIASFMAERWIELRKYQSYIAVMLSCLLSIYTSITYFVGRSHENNILNVMPVIVLAIAIVYLLNNSITLSYLGTLFKYFAFAFFIIITGMAIGNPPNILGSYFSGLKNGYEDIHKLLPSNPSNLDVLMINAGITEKDSVAFNDDVMLMNYCFNKQPFIHYNHWLPLNPMTSMNPLDLERKKIYLKRFSDRFKSGGYFIKNKYFNDSLLNFICRDYDSTGQVFENEYWKIIRFVRKGSKLTSEKVIRRVEQSLMTINFDSTDFPSMSKVINSEVVNSGKYSYLIKEPLKLSQEMIFKITQDQYEKISKCDIIKVRTSVYNCSDSLSGLYLVMDFMNNNGDNIYWANCRIKSGLPLKKWNEQEFLFLTPKNLEPGGAIKLYFTKPDSTNRYFIDHMFINTVKFLR